MDQLYSLQSGPKGGLMHAGEYVAAKKIGKPRLLDVKHSAEDPLNIYAPKRANSFRVVEERKGDKILVQYYESIGLPEMAIAGDATLEFGDPLGDGDDGDFGFDSMVD